jgi:ATP-dependent protease ClpP protease subunit
MSEVLLYGEIYSYSAQEFITAIQEIGGNDDLTVRLNTSGGSPEYGWGMVAKFSEHKGKKLVKVDGKAHSMGAYFLCYADDSEALDVSQMCIHRAAYPEWMESNNYVTQAMWDNLDAINGSLRKALEAKIDVPKFEKMKGVKMDDIFSNSSRIDVYLTASEAKQVGLINRVVKITPTIKAEIDRFAIAANVTEKPIQQNNSKMNIETIKAEHPSIYAEILALGEAQGVAKEKTRVTAWMKFNEIDAAAVNKGITEGAEMDMAAIAAFTATKLNATALNDIAADSSSATTKTGEQPVGANPEEAAKAKELLEFKANVDTHLNNTIK